MNVTVLASRLAAHKSRWEELERESGVPRNTFRKLVNGQTENPRLQTFSRLIETLDKWDRRGKVARA